MDWTRERRRISGGELGDVLLERLAKGVALGGADNFETSQCGGSRCGRKGCSEKKGARLIEEMINDEIGSCDEATGGSERLAEGSHLDIDLVGTVELGGKASASRPTDPVGVSFVEKKPSAELVFELDDFKKGSPVAIHGVEGFYDEKNLS
jgi:hypothetical protein